MKKSEIAKRMARQSGLSEAQGADNLGRVIHQILANLRKGNPTSLPGLGRFVKGPDGKVSFEPEGDPRRG
jgi:nucleoid DNA-binding protein